MADPKEIKVDFMFGLGANDAAQSIKICKPRAPEEGRRIKGNPISLLPSGAVILLSSFFTYGHALAVEECSAAARLHQTQCIARQIEVLDKQLNIVYRKALDAMPEKDAQDTRKEKEQLKRSQRAWLKYKDENCSLVGGLRGGSNLSITYFTAICQKEVIQERIQFLEQIPQERY